MITKIFHQHLTLSSLCYLPIFELFYPWVPILALRMKQKKTCNQYKQFLHIYTIPHSYILHKLVIFFPCQFTLPPLLDSFQLCDNEEIKHQNSNSYISSAWQCNFFCLKAVSSIEIKACLLPAHVYYTKDLTFAYIKLAERPIYSQWFYLVFRVQASCIFHSQGSDSSWTEPWSPCKRTEELKPHYYSYS